jgi:proteasome lid subunit RPN8/RPN11
MISSGAASPWPDTDWLEHPPQPVNEVALETRLSGPQAYPLHDSNYWVWSPPESPIPIFMHQRANRYIACHATNNSDREVGGLLLGQVIRDSEEGPAYPVISHAISARFAAEMRGHLTFTQQTWLDLLRQREEFHPDREVLGWYHTHPGFGIFLSEWDLLIQRSFFRELWQVALVVDPHDLTAGFFVWSRGDVLDPQHPHQLFRIAEADDGVVQGRKSRARIKLGEYVP